MAKSIKKKQYREQIKFLKQMTAALEIYIEEDSRYYDPAKALKILKSYSVVQQNLEFMVKTVAEEKQVAA